MRRQYVKLCDLRDFDDPELLAAVSSILPERDAQTHIERKVWEFAMLAMFLEEAHQLTEDTHALSVGAGDERIAFWLANRIGRVVATDVYGEGAFSGNEADPSMLEDPRAHAPFLYREDHLEVLWMDARELKFPSESFDVVFTLSSIEHFGSPADIARSAREIGRVLKPGGHAIVVTECFVRHHPLDTAAAEVAKRIVTLNRRMPGAQPGRRVALADVFTRRELARHIVGPSGLRLMQPLDTTISPQSWDNLTLCAPDGRLLPKTGEKYPSVLMQLRRSVFTSVCLILEKPPAPR
ncbi:MAG TPA: class I SAM-dependent methyltransferase [Solirubrobacteraceae bacterium]|jgi:ubiquinone/menaquinone biosynthesis C-methylase UbiE|nr:class I SAM-dependent methyltransferase [Solirubrobacteraceae bacterium]